MNDQTLERARMLLKCLKAMVPDAEKDREQKEPPAMPDKQGKPLRSHAPAESHPKDAGSPKSLL
ncbi:MAG: hypothetical protein RL213_1377 [Bacteroidota bacterium]|jgi:hypothetical protein